MEPYAWLAKVIGAEAYAAAGDRVYLYRGEIVCVAGCGPADPSVFRELGVPGGAEPAEPYVTEPWLTMTSRSPALLGLAESAPGSMIVYGYAGRPLLGVLGPRGLSLYETVFSIRGGPGGVGVEAGYLAAILPAFRGRVRLDAYHEGFLSVTGRSRGCRVECYAPVAAVFSKTALARGYRWPRGVLDLSVLERTHSVIRTLSGYELYLHRGRVIAFAEEPVPHAYVAEAGRFEGTYRVTGLGEDVLRVLGETASRPGPGTLHALGAAEPAGLPRVLRRLLRLYDDPASLGHSLCDARPEPRVYEAFACEPPPASPVCVSRGPCGGWVAVHPGIV